VDGRSSNDGDFNMPFWRVGEVGGVLAICEPGDMNLCPDGVDVWSGPLPGVSTVSI
jgi:hypothetical protein